MDDVTAVVAARAAHVAGAAASGAAHERAAGQGRTVKPPSGNTGAEITNPPPPLRPRPDNGVGVSVGWLSCTWVGHFATAAGFLEWVAPFLGELVYVPRRFRGYEVVYAGEHGVLMGCKLRPAYEDGPNVLELHLDCPAAVLEGMALDKLRPFLHAVAAYATNVTRLDVTLDDWQKRISPMDLERLTSGADDPYALNKRYTVTRAQQSDFRRSKGPRGGDSWYLGSKQGNALLRVYDKARESGGEVDAIRWELQLRGDSAKSGLVRLVLGGHGARFQNMGKWAASELVRFVDFRDREADSNVTRCPRLDWWEALVGSADRARPVVVPPPLTVDRMHKHAGKALPSWLATLADSAPAVTDGKQSPEGFILEMLRRGRQNRSERHRLALRSAGVAL